MTGKYIEKLLKIVEQLEKEAETCLGKSDEISHHSLLGKIKYLTGYVETLRDEVI